MPTGMEMVTVELAMGTERMVMVMAVIGPGGLLAREQLLARTVDRYDYVETRQPDTPSKGGGIGVE